MAMDCRSMAPMHRKRRRRRRQDRPPISAHLLLDGRIKEDVGVLSKDLFVDLFPGYKNDPEATKRIHHVAIAPWMPLSLSSPDLAQWTIVPVRLGDDEGASSRPHSSLQFPIDSLALQSFSNALKALSKTPHKRDVPIEIRISDVVPIGLNTIYVRLDTEALRKLENVHRQFGGGFGLNKSKGKAVDLTSPSHKVIQERKWRDAIRNALGVPSLIHTGDLLPLPLPAHPITHVPPPPAKITACEPLSQGIVLPSTRIVILPGKSKVAEDAAKSMAQRAPAANGIPEEDEDTSSEQFFSAAEELRTQPSSPPESDTEASITDADDLSDDPDDMLSLAPPSLPSGASGAASQAAATPRPGYPNGIATPGSTFSTSTVRGGDGIRSKTFKAFGLLHQVPDELLYPQPGTDDDEEARIFVETTALVKLGCFSGDWVRIEATTEASLSGFGHWHLGSFPDDQEPQEWRTAKIFSLPDSISKKDNRYFVHGTHEQPTSFFGANMLSPTSQAHLSPVTLANLGSPTHIKISALTTAKQGPAPGLVSRTKVSPITQPPLAKEVKLLKISTPLATDRTLQPSLFAGLKEFLECKRRVVKSGDLIAIPIDESLGKAVFEGDDGAADELLLKARAPSEVGIGAVRATTGVAWFKISELVASNKRPLDDDTWGGIMSIDASNATVAQAGTEQAQLPAATSSTWQYYLGLKRPTVAGTRAIGSYILSTDMPSPHVSSLRRRLRELISAATSPRAIHLGLPPVGILLTSTQRNIGKAFTVARVCEDLGLHIFSIDAFDILTEGGDVKTEGFLKARADRALSCGKQFTALLIKHVEKLDAERMVVALREILNDSRVLIATTTEVEKVPDGVRALFTHELEMNAPDEGERQGILRSVVEAASVRLAPDVALSSVAVKTAALVAGDLVDVIDRALVARQTRLDKLVSSAAKCLASANISDAVDVTQRDLHLAGHPTTLDLTTPDLSAAVDAARKNFADAIGAPKIPNVQWSDVGGLSHVKSTVMETIQLPLSRPELFAKGMKKRSGILFYGPPGTGKTLLAKAIATEFSLNFFSVKGPELLNMYIGESEANVRRVFQRARDARPCVVFFDELDSVAPKRGNQGDSGGVMDCIVSQLLAELDGMSGGGEDGQDGAAAGGQGVFVIGATNRPDLLDQALLRPGRFDKMLYLGVNDTHEGQLKVLEALTRKFSLDASMSLARVASHLPFTFTGADLYALCSDAMLKAITRSARLVDAKVADHNRAIVAANAAVPEHKRKAEISIAYFFDHLASAADTRVVVEEQDFENARRELVPSVSKDELWHYERVRRAFEGQTKKQPERTAVVEASSEASDAAPKAMVPTSGGSGKRATLVADGLPSGDHTLALRPRETEKESVQRGSWMKQARDRIKSRSLSRHGHRSRSFNAGAGGLAGLGQLSGKGKGRAFDMRSHTASSSDSPESVGHGTHSGSASAEGYDDDGDDEHARGGARSNGFAAATGTAARGKGKARAGVDGGGFGDVALDDDCLYA